MPTINERVASARVAVASRMPPDRVRGGTPVLPARPSLPAIKPPNGQRQFKVVSPQRHALPCVHEGAVFTFCTRSNKDVAEMRHVRGCDLYERCTRGFVSNTVRSCDRCGDYRAEGDDNSKGSDGGLAMGTVPPKIATSSPRVVPAPPRTRPTPISSPRERGGVGVKRVDKPVGIVIRPRGPRVGISKLQAGFNATHKQPAKRRGFVWSYGVTTVPERRKELLPNALHSLTSAGFPTPVLFVDGDWDYASWYEEFKLPCVMRYPRIRTYGNWILALAELYIRNPFADYFAIFQDDIVCSKNLRQYIEASPFPDKGYLNLYTFPENQELCDDAPGFYRSNQKGKGALGLVFTLEGVKLLLAHNHMVKRPPDRVRGHRFVDGAVVETMHLEGWTEYVHNPSPLQHKGVVSATGNPTNPQARSFRGEGYDFLTLLRGAPES